MFFEEFSTLMSNRIEQPGDLLLCGDFNLHLDDHSDPNVEQFMQLLDSYDLIQHMQGQTQRSGHTLDLIITRSSESVLVEISL